MRNLLWYGPNSSPSSNFAAKTLNLNLNAYKYIIVSVRDNTKNADMSHGIVPIGSSDAVGIGRPNYSTTVRWFKATKTSVVISDAKYATSTYNNEVIPYKIYGVKNDLGI